MLKIVCAALKAKANAWIFDINDKAIIAPEAKAKDIKFDLKTKAWHHM